MGIFEAIFFAPHKEKLTVTSTEWGAETLIHETVSHNNMTIAIGWHSALIRLHLAI